MLMLLGSILGLWFLGLLAYRASYVGNAIINVIATLIIAIAGMVAIFYYFAYPLLLYSATDEGIYIHSEKLPSTVDAINEVDKAFYWYEKAAKQGNKQALQDIDELAELEAFDLILPGLKF